MSDKELQKRCLDNLVVFSGDPTECCNQLIDWYNIEFKNTKK